VLNRLWIDTARAELIVTTDAAALAAARALVDDDLLKLNANPASRIFSARMAAGNVASQNFVAGEPLNLDLSDDGDVRFGKLVSDAEERTIFLETETGATTVVVTGRRSHESANPLGMLLSGVTKRAGVDVMRRSEASISNAALALRAGSGFNVPAFPLAILHVDPSGRQPITWATQIDARGGPDLFTYNEETGKVTPGPDGIPEMILNGIDPNQPPNTCLIDVGTALAPGKVATQIKEGWSAEDLKTLGGDVPLFGKPFGSSPLLTIEQLKAFASMQGQARAVMLYASPAGEASAVAGIVSTGCVAVRVMEVIPAPGGTAFRMIVQPAVLVSRAVVLEGENASSSMPGLANKYLYKLTLTQ